MRLQILSVLAAGLLLAACSSDEPVETASTQGAGSTTQTGAATAGAATPGSLEDFNQNVGNTVYFGYDRYDLTAEAQSQLQKEAAWLQQYPQHTLTVEGHCDERGTREYNLALGERRANSVANYLTRLASTSRGSARSPTARSVRSAPTPTRPATRRTVVASRRSTSNRR
jgi:peptidoglycan-associated lipoprotein